MFSYDEDGLFVLEFEPPLDPDSYFVRRLDLATGEMTDTGRPQVGLNPQDAGPGPGAGAAPGRRPVLFTLYTRARTTVEPVFDARARRRHAAATRSST